MEPRIAALEAGFQDMRVVLARLEPVLTRVDERTRKIEADVVALKVDLAELKGRVSQLPTTIQMIGFVLAVLALAGFGKYLGR